MSFPLYRQLDKMDCGPTCLKMIAQYHGKHLSIQKLRERSNFSNQGVSILGIAEAAETIGLRALSVNITIDKLVASAPLPCVLHWNQNHFVVLHKIRSGIKNKKENEDYNAAEIGEIIKRIWNAFSVAREGNSQFYIADPARGKLILSQKAFEEHWLKDIARKDLGGVALLVEPTTQFYAREDEKNEALSIFEILKYIGSFKKLLVQLAFGFFLSSILSLFFPLLTKSIVDVGINTSNIGYIELILFAQIALLLGTSSIDFIRSWILLHISTRINVTILSQFIAKLMRLPVSFYATKSHGDILQRIGDHRRIEAFLTGQGLSFLFGISNLIVFGIILALANLLIFGVAVLAGALYVSWVTLFLNKRGSLDSRRFRLSSQTQSQVVQMVSGMQDIRLAGAEIVRRFEWERIQAKLFSLNVSSLTLTQIQQGGGLFINQGKNILITFLSAKAVINGQLTLGEMMSIQYILGQFNAPVEQFVTMMQSWQDAKLSLSRLNEVHTIPDEESAETMRNKEWEFRHHILLKDLSFRYPGGSDEHIIDGLTLKIPYGKVTAIVGKSGSGKTTLLKLILRFYELAKGSILLEPVQSDNPGSLAHSEQRTKRPVDLQKISQKAWRMNCGAVLQDGFIFSDTIARNIALSNEVVDYERLADSCMVADIHDFIETLPMGYDTKIGPEGTGLSQGQRQRILIARAIYKDPKILLFDEATNSLDSLTESVITSNLNKFIKTRTAVVVAHRLSTIRNADQIVVMENGKIVELGTHDNLLKLQGVYHKLLNNQVDAKADDQIQEYAQ